MATVQGIFTATVCLIPFRLDRAAAFAEKDQMQSVSDNIMLGQLCPIGTGSFTLLLDERRLADAIDVSAGFMYGDADIEGRGGLTPGTSPCCFLPALDKFANIAAWHRGDRPDAF